MLINSCLSCYFHAYFSLKLHVCPYICHKKCIFPLKRMKTLIFTLLKFSQTPNSNFHFVANFLLKCLSLRPKACVYFVLVFVFFLFAFRFSLHFGRNCKFFPKNLSTFHFTPPSTSLCNCIISFHIHNYIPRHITSISFINNYTSRAITCNSTFHVMTHCISFSTCDYM